MKFNLNIKRKEDESIVLIKNQYQIKFIEINVEEIHIRIDNKEEVRSLIKCQNCLIPIMY